MSRKILIIEDDRGAARLAGYTLEQAGYEVVNAYDGFDGLNRAIKDRPDLVVLDIMLPGLDGYEVCNRLRQKPETAMLPILMMSAKVRQEDKDVGLKMGADDYLTKPVEPSVMLAKVRILLSNAGKVVYDES